MKDTKKLPYDSVWCEPKVKLSSDTSTPTMLSQACMLRSGFTYKHYITLDGPGGEDFRKHSTTCRSPGSFQVMAGEGVPDNQPGIFLDAENGDIVIKRPMVVVRIEGIDVDIRYNGSDGKRGNIIH